MTGNRRKSNRRKEISTQGRARSTIWISALLMAGGLALTAPVAAATAQQPGSTAGASGSSGNATGGANSGSGGKPAAAGAGSGGAAATGGEKLFQSAMPPCGTCHQLKAGVNQPGPSLAGVAARAQQRIAAKDYKGKAKDARAYLRESIMDPNAYIVPGQAYAANGKSLMPATYAQSLKPEQIDQLVNYLMTLK